MANTSAETNPQQVVKSDPILELVRLLDKINQREKVVDIPQKGQEDVSD